MLRFRREGAAAGGEARGRACSRGGGSCLGWMGRRGMAGATAAENGAAKNAGRDEIAFRSDEDAAPLSLQGRGKRREAARVRACRGPWRPSPWRSTPVPLPCRERDLLELVPK